MNYSLQKHVLLLYISAMTIQWYMSSDNFVHFKITSENIMFAQNRYVVLTPNIASMVSWHIKNLLSSTYGSFELELCKYFVLDDIQYQILVAYSIWLRYEKNNLYRNQWITEANGYRNCIYQIYIVWVYNVNIRLLSSFWSFSKMTRVGKTAYM